MKRRLWRGAAALVTLIFLLTGCASGTVPISGLEDVNRSEFRLGTETGSHTQDQAEEVFPEAELQLFATFMDGIAALKAQKIDGFLFDKVVLDQICAEDSSLAVLDGSIGGSDVAIALAKGSETLRERVNAVLAALKEDGTLSDMERRWIDGEDRTMPALEAPENPTGTLRILTEGMTIPFGYLDGGEDGEVIGFDIELGARVAYALGMDYSVETMSFSALIPALIAGKGDIVLANMVITEERKKEILFSDPYYFTPTAVAVRKDRLSSAVTTIDPTDEEREAYLSSAKIGVLLGTIPELYAEEHYPNAEILKYDARTDEIAALMAGKVDCVLLPKTQAKMFVRQQAGFSYSTNPLYSNPVYFIVNTGKQDLRASLNEALAELKADGTVDALYEKWTSGDYSMEDIPVNENAPVLRAAVCSTSEPLSFVYNNEIVGFECELIARLAYKMGMRVEFQDMSFGALLSAVASGKADIASGLAYTEERAKEADFSEPYYSEDITYIIKNGTATETGSFAEKIKDDFTGTFLTEGRWKLFLKGIGITIFISVCAYALGTALGLGLCKALNSRSRLWRKAAEIYGKIVTGIPILVWLMILYYMVFRSVDIPGILVAIIGFGLEGGASLSGVFKTGLDSVDKGQIEAAYAIGFRQRAIFRRIVFPQAAAHVFDLYTGYFVSLVKSTSIVGYIAITDLTKVSDIVRSRTYQPFFPLITTALIYFAITCVFIALLKFLRHRFDPKRRRSMLKGVKLR